MVGNLYEFQVNNCLIKVKSVLVTGATGFIGRQLLCSERIQSIRVRIVTRQNSSSNTINHFPSTYIDDISPETDWTRALENIDTVIHLAARAHVLNESASDPEIEFKRINTYGTSNLVQQAVQAGVKHFIFVSSIGAMGSLRSDILTENSPCSPDTAYGRSKLEAEQKIIRISAESQMEWTILRPTLVYGPGNPGNMERLIRLIDRRLPLPLGAVHNRRSLLYVGNLIDAIFRCLEHPNARQQIFIVSDGYDLSTTELIRQLGIALKQQAFLAPVPTKILKLLGILTSQEDAIDRLIGDLSVSSQKIQNVLDWSPPYSLSEGLEVTCDWYRQVQSLR